MIPEPACPDPRSAGPGTRCGGLSGEPVVNLIITGVGGQGNVVAARLLGAALLAADFEVAVGDVFGLAQRGGAVASHVRFHRGAPLAPLVPQGSLDILVGFEPLEALRVLAQYGRPGTLVLTNDRAVPPVGVLQGRSEYPAEDVLFGSMAKLAGRVARLNAVNLAHEAGGPQSVNVVMLGALSGLAVLPLPRGFLQTEVERLSARHREANRRAFALGVEAVGAGG